MHRVVIDTNVLISSRLSKYGIPARIMDLIVDEKIELCYSLEILDEYKRVLAYEKLKFDVKKQRATINEIKEIGILINPARSDVPFDRDKSDRIFYDTAKESGAILITGNMKHYPQENFIMLPSEYIRFYERQVLF